MDYIAGVMLGTHPVAYLIYFISTEISLSLIHISIRSGTHTATLRFGHDGNIIPLVALLQDVYKRQVEWLAVGTHATTPVPTKKAALGFLAKACLQTSEYGSTEYLQKALDVYKRQGVCRWMAGYW